MSPVLEEYLAAVSVGDRAGALDLVRRLQKDGASPLEVMTGVIAPAQARVGELWASDAWSVAQEHAATAVSEAVLGMLGAQIPAPLDTSSPVVVTCVEQEWHALPALLVAEHLRSAGIPVSYLGANASAEHLVRHVHEVGPRAVALSCSLSASLPRVRRQIEAVRATGTPVVVGGAAFDRPGRRAQALGATGFAVSGAEAVSAVEALPAATRPAEPLTHPWAEEGFAIHADREPLTAALRERVAGNRPADSLEDVLSGWQPALLDHLPHLVGALAGALVAGDRTVVEEAAVWLEDVMSHRDAPRGTIHVVMGELRTLVREYPSASELLSALPAAG
ncbi:MAG TPA: cobalamin-dependent protein [Nocardioidaceae bacterium]|nr:cobalamin-dependent protein [Nocardioidaceae bacterium]